MPTVSLPDRSLFTVTGADAEHFLQNILTSDLDKLEAGTWRPCALLTPQGKILFDFLIARAEDGFVIDCRSDVGPDLVKRLSLYKLRAKVDISQPERGVVHARWQDDSAASGDESTPADLPWRRDIRFRDFAVHRMHGAGVEADAALEQWSLLRIRHGVAESGSDFELGDAFPHDVAMDDNGGVGLRKGCYVGQEVVSRMHHRGTARRRVLVLEGQQPLPPSGAAVTTAGKPAGTVGTVVGSQGLAILRIDRVGEALKEHAPIEAGGIAITPHLPPGVNYGWPQEAAETQD